MTDNEVIDRQKAAVPEATAMDDGKVIDFGENVEDFFRGLVRPAAEAAVLPAAAEGGDKVLPFDKPSPAAIGEGGRQELAKKADPLPETPQEEYRPHAGFLNRLQAEQRTFYIVFADCTFRGFPYAHYDGIRLERADSPGGGLVLVVRFCGSVTEEVWIEGQGPDVRYVALCIGMGIMPWIWELPPGKKVKSDAATVITHITVKEIKR